MKAVNVGVIGFGTVGTGVVRLLIEQRELLARRLGADLVLAKVADLEREYASLGPRGAGRSYDF